MGVLNEKRCKNQKRSGKSNTIVGDSPTIDLHL